LPCFRAWSRSRAVAAGSGSPKAASRIRTMSFASASVVSFWVKGRIWDWTYPSKRLKVYAIRRAEVGNLAASLYNFARICATKRSSLSRVPSNMAGSGTGSPLCSRSPMGARESWWMSLRAWPSSSSASSRRSWDTAVGCVQDGSGQYLYFVKGGLEGRSPCADMAGMLG